MAIACLRLVTFFPLRPRFSLPRFIWCISVSTCLLAAEPYLRVDFLAGFFAAAFLGAFRPAILELFFAAFFVAIVYLLLRLLCIWNNLATYWDAWFWDRAWQAV
jgi:hypothetical protein